MRECVIEFAEVQLGALACGKELPRGQLHCFLTEPINIYLLWEAYVAIRDCRVFESFLFFLTQRHSPRMFDVHFVSELDSH